MKHSNTKSDCDAVSQKLVSLLDDHRLDQIDAAMKKHLESCADCHNEYTGLLELEKALTTAAIEDPGQEYWINFLPRLHQRIDQRGVSKRSKDFAWIPSFAMAALLMIVLLKSPVPVAPPTWYANYYGEYSLPPISGLSEMSTDGYYSDLISDESSTDSGDLSDSDLSAIDELSNTSKYISTDPVDLLLELDDASLEKLFQQLKERTIAKSS